MMHTRPCLAALAVGLALAVPAVRAAGLEAAPGPGGLSALRAGGRDLLADGTFRVTGAFFREPDGDVVAADLDAATGGEPGRPVLAFPWGRVGAAYAIENGRLVVDVSVQVAEDAPGELVALYVEPLVLRLEGERETENLSWLFYMKSDLAHNLQGLGVVASRGPGGLVAVCAEQVARPLAAGFGKPRGPGKTEVPVLAFTGRHPLETKKFPWIDRPVAPGGTDRWRISLRAAPADAQLDAVVADLCRRFAEAYPFELAWDDRRPIGMCMLSSAGQDWPGNPRGWHHSVKKPKELDTGTDEGREAFKTDVLAYADRIVRVAGGLNAQGVVVWDVEGQEYPHMISFLGDPRSLPPEMRLPVGEGEDAKPLADAFFDRIRAAGLRTGICVRPQRPMRPAYDDKVEQVAWRDRTARFKNLSDKIRHATERWGCTLFYLDSDIVWVGDPVKIPDAAGYTALPDAQLLRDLMREHPDILVLPEWETLRCYAYAAPYSQLNHNKLTAPPPYALRTYPEAFFVNRIGRADAEGKLAELAASVRRGDILFYTGWYDAPENTLVREIYRDAGAAPAAP